MQLSTRTRRLEVSETLQAVETIGAAVQACVSPGLQYRNFFTPTLPLLFSLPTGVKTLRHLSLKFSGY